MDAEIARLTVDIHRKPLFSRLIHLTWFGRRGDASLEEEGAAGRVAAGQGDSQATGKEGDGAEGHGVGAAAQTSTPKAPAKVKVAAKAGGGAAGERAGTPSAAGSRAGAGSEAEAGAGPGAGAGAGSGANVGGESSDRVPALPSSSPPVGYSWWQRLWGPG